MRTTLDIEEDVLFAAKDLARKGLTGAAALTAGEAKAVYGFRPFPKEGRIVSNELINKLREDGEY